MKIETIVVLILTAITVGALVWIEIRSRRNPAPGPALKPSADSTSKTLAVPPNAKRRR